MNYSAPIILFTYKRLQPLKGTINYLLQNYLAASSNLFIFSDGAKSERDQIQVDQVREYLKSISGFKNVTITEAPNNKGLASSIIDGVTEVLKSYDRVIVLEDDLLTTTNFLIFMNRALFEYERTDKVFSISGYSFNLGIAEDSSDAYFLNRGWSWGWATWKDRWEKVDWNMKDYEDFKSNKQKQKEFSKGGSDLNKMLRHQMQGKLDSWAIRWFYHQYKIKGLTLYPVYSKVYNNGFDALATHTVGSSKRYQPIIDKSMHFEFSFPPCIDIHPYYQGKFQKKMGFKERLRSRIEGFMINLFGRADETVN